MTASRGRELGEVVRAELDSLCSEASPSLTGHSLAVDGEMTAGSR